MIRTKQGSAVTDEMLDEWAEAFERGEWPDGQTVKRDPAEIRGERLKAVTFKMPERKVMAFDKKAAEKGETRSDALRRAVDAYLAIA